MGVGRNSQQQAGANVIDTGVTSSAAGDGTVNKNYIFTIGAVIACITVAVFTVGIYFAVVGGLARGIIANALAEGTIGSITVITNGDIHSSAEPFLGGDVGITIHSAKLRQRIGVGLGTIAILRHSSDRQHDGQHKDSQQNA